MTSLADLTARTPGLPCRLDPETWFSDNSRQRDAAARLCRDCPLRVECADHALQKRIPHGVWGGTTAAERRAFWTGVPWRFDEQGRLRLVCGSERAYRAHFTYRERPGADCVGGDCVAAHEALVTEQRRARLAEEHAKGGTIRGYEIHRALGEPACGACRRASARASAARRGRGRACGRSAAPESGARLPGGPAPVQPASRAA